MDYIAILKPIADTLLDHLSKEAENAQRIAESKLKTALLEKEETDRKRDLVNEARRNAESFLTYCRTTPAPEPTDEQQRQFDEWFEASLDRARKHFEPDASPASDPTKPLPTPPEVEERMKLNRQQYGSIM